MEFKDKLKQQRLQKGVSQQKLADAIFVSRSAVAKWENGLGIPNEASYAALLTYFELTAEQFPLNEETEEISVSKNKTIRRLIACVISLSVVVAITLTLLVLGASKRGFGLTSGMAVGAEWRGTECYHTDEYDFYAKYLGSADGEWVNMVEFVAVQKQAIGYQRLDIEAYRQVVYLDDVYVGDIYAFPTSDGYRYVIPMTKHIQADDGKKVNLILKSFPYITVDGETYTAAHNAFFYLPYRIKTFDFKDEHYSIRVTRGDEKLSYSLQ